MIEAKKLAYADMIRYDAIPRFAKIPVEGLRSKDFAATRASLIDAAKAKCDVPAELRPASTMARRIFPPSIATATWCR
jgi:gamma-glutamyltranspeptidase/glutathione hydrolase